MKYTNTSIHFPDAELKAKIKMLAKAEKKSANEMIITMLEEGVQKRLSSPNLLTIEEVQNAS